MARPIDEKIVAMKLDNADFANKAAETVGIMGRLTGMLNKIPGINLGRPAQGVAEISTAANGATTSLGGLGGAVDQIASRFSVMGMVATTALTNVVNRAVDAGIQLGKSLTIDQVTAGFKEYETKIGSIQTILANTQADGTTLSDVNKSLGELNTYADQTIYNFGEMTKNIGFFTNAGLGLEESTSMIKGFSNAAAASGANAEQAARAAYQLSQGLSSGTIIQQDWMSLTNAGMGNDNMKRDIIAVAQAMGELEGYDPDEVVKDWKNLLTDKRWLTKDIMSTYLQTMAGDMDKAKLKAIGLTDAQADLMLQNAKTGEEAATKTRTFTQLMNTLKESIGSSWSQSFELIFGGFNDATNLWSSAGAVLGDLVGKSSDARNKYIRDFEIFGGKQAIISSISNLFSNLTKVLGIAKEAFQSVFPPIAPRILAEMAKNFLAFTEKIKVSTKSGAQLKTIFTGIFSVFRTVYDIARTLGETIINIIPEGTGGAILDFILKLAEMSTNFSKSVQTGNGLTTFIKSLGEVLSSLITVLTNVSKFLGGTVIAAFNGLVKVGKELQPIFEGVGKAIAKAAKGLSIEDLFAGGFIAGILLIAKAIKDTSDNIGGFLETITETIGNIGEGFGGMEDIVETLGGIGDALNAMTTGVRVFTLLQIAVSVGILAVSMKMIADLPAQDIFKSLQVIGLALAGITWALLAISKFDFSGKGTFGASVLLLAVANALLVLAVALKVMSKIKPKEMITALAGLVVTMGALVLTLGALSKMGPSIKINAIALLGMATSIVILAGALKILSQIKASSLIKSLGALIVVFGTIAVFLKVVSGAKLNPMTALSMNLIATAILGIATSMYMIAGLDVGSIVKALITIGLILTQIVIFSKLVKGPSMIPAAIAMNLIAVALNMLIVPVKVLGGLDLKDLAKGLGAMAITLGLVVLAMAGASGGIVGAVAITAVAIAIGILVPPLLALSNLSLKEVGIGLLALAGAFTVIGLAAVILGTVAAPAMAIFAVTLLVIGVAMAGIGLGMSAFAAGITALVAITVTSVAGIAGALVLLLKALAQAIPAVIKVISAFLTGLTGMFAKEAPKMTQHILTGLLGIITAIGENVPQIITAATNLMIGFSEAIRGAVPDLVNEAVKLVITFIQAMADTIHQNHEMLVVAVFQLMYAILEVVIDVMEELINVLFGWIPGVEVATGAIGTAAKNALSEKFTALEVGSQKGTDFAGGVSGKSGDARTAGARLGESAKTGATGLNLLTVGQEKGKGFATGMSGTSGNARSAGEAIVSAGKSGASSGDLSSNGQNFGLGFANGMANSTVLGRVVNAGIAIARAAKNAVSGWLDEHSPSKVMEQSGIFFSEGFANGIIKMGGFVADKAKRVAQVAQETLNGFIEDFDPDPDDTELHFKAVVDYDNLDPNKFGQLSPLALQPDLSRTNALVGMTRAQTRQNANINPTVSVNQGNTQSQQDQNNLTKQPIVLQTVLNGRVLAEEIIEDVSQLQNHRQRMVDRARGVY